MERRARVSERPPTTSAHSEPETKTATLPVAKRPAAQRIISALANGSLAFLLIVSLCPLIIAVGALVWLSDGRPIIYSGRRLGYGGREFKIHKFRTLVVDAERKLGSELVSRTESKRDLTIRFGKFLRATRLDELPQLWNVFRNEMSFIGPRPERPDVYRENCAKIENYDLRFSVKPGLIGVSQVVTPHCTEKRYRTWLDNRVLRSRPSYGKKLGFLFYAGSHLVGSLLRNVRDVLVDKLLKQRLFRTYHQKRASRRYRANKAFVFFGDQRRYPVRNVSEDAILILSDSRLSEKFPSVFTLRLELEAKNELPRIRRANCLGELVGVREVNGIFETVVLFKPTTPKSEYLIQKYLLRESIV